MYTSHSGHIKIITTNTFYGLHTEFRMGVEGGIVRERIGAFDGVAGRMAKGDSGSARRMNCSGVNGEPLDDGVERRERGLCPEGVDRAKEGRKDPLGSGVRGGCGGDPALLAISTASANVAELIQRSSRAPVFGESGIKRKLSAK